MASADADLVVMKFGGTSVSGTGELKRAAGRIVAAREQGMNVVAVLSARGKTTDRLLEAAREISPRPDPREMDMMLSIGERESCALSAQAPLAILSAELQDPAGYGRVVRDPATGRVVGVVEEAEADARTLALREVNSGLMAFRADWLWGQLPSLPLRPRGEYYLTDLVAAALKQDREVAIVVADDPSEALGVNTQRQLAEANRVSWQRSAERLMDGVGILKLLNRIPFRTRGGVHFVRKLLLMQSILATKMRHRSTASHDIQPRRQARSISQ